MIERITVRGWDHKRHPLKDRFLIQVQFAKSGFIPQATDFQIVLAEDFDRLQKIVTDLRLEHSKGHVSEFGNCDTCSIFADYEKFMRGEK